MSHAQARHRRSTWPWTMGVLAVVVVGACLWAFLFSPASVQRRNMGVAAEHNERLRSRLAGDARFVGIDLGEYTGGDGGGSISGTVNSREDAEALLRIVVESKPPRFILWNVTLEQDTDFAYYQHAPRHVMPDGAIVRR